MKEEIKKLIYEELPKILRKHPEVRIELWRMLSSLFAPREQTEDRFEKLLKEIQIQREEANKRFEQHQKRLEEFAKRFEVYDKRFEEHQKRFEELLKEIRRVDRRIDRTIGALGARWGISTEYAFREAIKSVIEELTGLKVERYLSYDSEGEVFGWPDQVELDIVIKDGMVWVMEIKSSVSKSEVYTFLRKVNFYEKKENKKVLRKIIVSPMIEPTARDVAERLNIEYYTAPEDLPI
ncbi:MAG: DUF3782 domain-containing protein [Candidatus Desulfofervidus auxilii]|nr:DUF3782 domain-containing protein [Candidatus Desulfofervidus auxilii]